MDTRESASIPNASSGSLSGHSRPLSLWRTMSQIFMLLELEPIFFVYFEAGRVTSNTVLGS